MIRIRPVYGEEITVSVNGVQLFDQDGKLAGAVVAMHNINHRLTAEKKLRISEQTFRGSFEHAAIGMAILNISGEWLSVNKSLCNIIGYNEEELRKLTFQDITHPDDLNTDLSLLNELVAGEREFYHMEKDISIRTDRSYSSNLPYHWFGIIKADHCILFHKLQILLKKKSLQKNCD